MVDVDMLLPKHPPFKSRKLQRAAQEAPCMHCGQRGTVVLAHMPIAGNHGMGTKCDDWWGAYLCHECHTYADGHGRKDWAWRALMVYRTQRYLQDIGLIVVQE